jgi:uncharacterized membrane protein
VLCTVTLLVSPLLRAAGDYDFTLRDVLWGFFANAYFPLLPWIVYPLMGFLLADVVLGRPGRTNAFPAWICLTGAALMGLALLGVVFRAHLPALLRKHYVTGFTRFPASTEYVAGTLGFSMVSLVLLHHWIDRNPRAATRWLTFLRRYSVFSLTVYILHHVAHLGPLWAYGAWRHDDPTYYWRQAMDTPTALALALAFVVACHGLLAFLERRGSYGLESPMRWLCD